MQMNVYVPSDRADVLERLDRAVRRLDRSKNELVLEAIAEKLDRLEAQERSGRPRFGTTPIGAGEFSREELYRERLDR